MPRPTSKHDLLAAIDKERGALDTYLGTLSPEEMIGPGIVGDWSVKDVLAHLVEWEQMCLGWYRAGMKDEVPPLPAPGYKWNQTPALNEMIYEKYCEWELADVLERFHRSHSEILGVINDLSDDQLFTRSVYGWTGKNTMGTYFVSATSSHYLWASKEIRKGFRNRK